MLETILGMGEFFGEISLCLTEGKIKPTHDSGLRLPPEEKFRHHFESLVTQTLIRDSYGTWALHDWSQDTLTIRGIRKLFQIAMLHTMVMMTAGHPCFKAILTWFVGCSMQNFAQMSHSSRQGKLLQKGSEASTEGGNISGCPPPVYKVSYTCTGNALLVSFPAGKCCPDIPKKWDWVNYYFQEHICLKKSRKMTYLQYQVKYSSCLPSQNGSEPSPW